MRSYQASRNIFGFIEFLSWASLVIGGVCIVFAMNALGSNSFGRIDPGVFAGIPGVILILYGLLGIMIAQTARASVDTAELTGQMLKVARDQLEVSKATLRGGNTPASSFDTLQPAPQPAPSASYATRQNTQTVPEAAGAAPEQISYAGHIIEALPNRYRVAGLMFADLVAAQQHVDALTGTNLVGTTA
jgi:hypothetical protein